MIYTNALHYDALPFWCLSALLAHCSLCSSPSLEVHSLDDFSIHREIECDPITSLPLPVVILQKCLHEVDNLMLCLHLLSVHVCQGWRRTRGHWWSRRQPRRWASLVLSPVTRVHVCFGTPSAYSVRARRWTMLCPCSQTNGPPLATSEYEEVKLCVCVSVSQAVHIWININIWINSWAAHQLGSLNMLLYFNPRTTAVWVQKWLSVWS